MLSKEEKKKYSIFLKILKKLKKSELSEFLDNLSSEGVNKICRCLYNTAYHDIGLKKKSKNIQILKQHLNKNKKNIQFLSKYSPSKKIIERKRKVLQSGGFPLLPILSTVIPTLLALFKR